MLQAEHAKIEEPAAEHASRPPAWLVIVAAAAAVRLYAAWQLGCLSRDGIAFVTLAKRLAVEPITALTDTLKQPGFSALMLLVNRVAINEPYRDHPIAWQYCGQFLALTGGVACCLLIYALTLRLFNDKRAALAAGLLAAAWPQGVALSADVLSDTTHLALYLAGFWAGWEAIRSGRLVQFFSCGLLAGIAYLVRQEALGLPVAVACCVPWPGPIRPRRRVIGAAVMFLTFSAVAAPPSIATGRLMPNKNLRDLFFGADMASMSIPAGESKASVGTSSIPGASSVGEDSAARFAHFIPWYQAPARMVEEWCRSGRYVISTLALIALFLKSAPRAQPIGARLTLAAIALQLLAVQLRVSSYGEISSRYVLIPAALCIPWAGAALSMLAPMLAARLSASLSDINSREELAAAEQRRLTSIRLSVSILVFAPLLFYATRPVNADRAAYKLAGWYLRENSERGRVILAHDRLDFVMFYSGRTWPDATWRSYEQEPVEPGASEVAVVASRLAELHGLIRMTRSDYFLDARASRKGSTAGDAAYFDALLRGDVPGLSLAWSSGPSEHHEVYLFRVEGD